jgi:hypothetical protein
MLIGLSGKAGSGKTTLAQVAEQEFSFTRTSFAGTLKSELIIYLKANNYIFDAANFYGDAKNKNRLIGVPDSTEIPKELIDYHSLVNMQVISHRNVMKWYGDKQRLVNKDYWLQRFMETTDFSNDVIVDDVRYTNEAALIHALGGILIRIDWPSHSIDDRHPSETQLDNFPLFDARIIKEQDISAEEYHCMCRDNLNLWLGYLDDTPSQYPTSSKMTFKSSSLSTIWTSRHDSRRNSKTNS